MKIILSILLLSASVTVSAQTQNNDQQDVCTTIQKFAAAGDIQDAKALELLLDSNYRIVMNQLFGSSGVAIMDRAAYLDKIRKKEFGGDKREVIIESVSVNGNTAVAKVIMKGAKLTFVSTIQLIKNSSGKWLIISDTPVIKS